MPASSILPLRTTTRATYRTVPGPTYPPASCRIVPTVVRMMLVLASTRL